MILLDFSPVVIASITAMFDDVRDNPQMIKHVVLNTLRKVNAEHRSEYGELIVCVDAKAGYWRRDVFENYKRNRKRTRDKDKDLWTLIYESLDELVPSLKEHAPFKVIEVDRCEADDVIAVIANDAASRNETVLIVSPDRDFVQLQRNPLIKQYSLIQEKWVVPDATPTQDLLLKIFKGDSKDGVPNVLSDDDVFLTEGVRQTPMTKKRIDALLDNVAAFGDDVAARVKRNRTLIDLSFVPEQLHASILDIYSNAKRHTLQDFMAYLQQEGMGGMLACLSDFSRN